MRGFLNLIVRWAIVALGVALAAAILPGIRYSNGTTLALVAVLLGLFNAFLKPVLVMFALPFVILTLGLGLWVINAVVLWLTGKLLAPEFVVEGFGSALLGAAIISFTNMALSSLTGEKKHRLNFRRGAPPPANPPPRDARRRDDDVIDI